MPNTQDNTLSARRAFLEAGGWLVRGMGAGQRAALTGILGRTGLFGEIRFRADLAGLDRVVIARRIDSL